VLGVKERRPPGKAAIVCCQPLDLGIARMMATYLSMEGYPARLQPFMDLSSATAWLSDVDRK
jgi:hypothetical protein